MFAAARRSARPGSGARSGRTERRAYASRDRRRSRLAMEQGAPAAVVFAAGLTAASWIAFPRNGPLVEAPRGRGVRGAPADVQNLQTRVGIGLARGGGRAAGRGGVPRVA